VSIFGGVLWGVTLEVAQQSQTDAHPPVWDYHRSGTWGGHAVMCGKYAEGTQDAEVITWAMDVATTASFRREQLEEAWVVVWQWNLDHPAFQEGIDLTALANAYETLTGRPLPVPTPTPAPPAPEPTPTPEPPSDPDHALWQAVQHWIVERHLREAKEVVEALKTWAKAKGFI
jgi:hypothetical protein